MTKIEELKKELRSYINPEKAEYLNRYFKTGKGEYGEGDKFLGVMVPNSKIVAKKFKDLPLEDLLKLLHSEWHEERLVAVFILVLKFEKGSEDAKKEIYDLYLENTKYVNNWDLVDSSSEFIVGPYLRDKPKDILFKLAKSDLVWERRIAMLATFDYIRHGENKVAFEIAEILLEDEHDLIQKAVGWMLKEIGKRSGIEVEEEFLKKHYKRMPRTMLRYSIEKFPEEKRKFYLAK